MLLLSSTLLLFTFTTLVSGDTYLHYPRGSNNRLDENTQNRRNGNRMFDSQNNNDGGYNIGDRDSRPAGNDVNKQYRMQYFMSAPPATTTQGKGASYFPIEWTNQHGCGKNDPADPNVLNCNMVLQFMCRPDDGINRDAMRDGTSTQTNDYTKPRNNGNSQERVRDFENRKRGRNRVDRGMNEPFEWRDKCESRNRNTGLFTADQKVKSTKSTNTRQNPNGNRNGYECPEERDYYPYWHPTDWRDIAILSEDPALCNYYKTESFNVKPKHECRERFRDSTQHSHYSPANSAAQCAQRGGQWTPVHNYLEKLNIGEAACKARTDTTWGHAIYGKGQEECLVNVPAPDCKAAAFTRVNHLGNSEDLKANKYMWQVPHFPSGQAQKCVFRMRYNMSTDDYDPYKTDSKSNNNDDVIEDDPLVDVGLDGGQKLQLALNTAQTGRTFQDRSHVFEIKPRDPALGDKNMHFLSVRGKRGNIVQTYPGVEYDFVPNDLEVKRDELVHIQWTGSNTHNNKDNGGDGQPGDDGEGRGGTDRTNMMAMLDRSKNFFMTMEDPRNMVNNMNVVWAASGGERTMTKDDVAVQLATSGQYQCKTGCRNSATSRRNWQNQLDNAPASFPGMVVSFKNPGEHAYGCTRNNNFSNRSQKAKLVVK